MALCWQTAGDDKVCGDCAAMDGKPDGDGWCTALETADECWAQDPATGQWHHLVAGEVPSGPPLHPNCRCGLAEIASVTAWTISLTPPTTTTEEFVYRITHWPW